MKLHSLILGLWMLVLVFFATWIVVVTIEKDDEDRLQTLRDVDSLSEDLIFAEEYIALLEDSIEMYKWALGSMSTKQKTNTELIGSYVSDDIYYIKGNRVSSESGLIDSLCKSRTQAIDYFEDVTVRNVERLGCYFADIMANTVVVYDEKYDIIYLDIEQTYAPEWTVNVAYRRIKDTNVYNVFNCQSTWNDQDSDTGRIYSAK